MPQPTRHVPQYLSIKNLAQRLEVSPRTIHRWIAAGQLRVHTPGGLVRVSEEDVAAFMAARRR
jgi:excisionase family DNA binding protein